MYFGITNSPATFQTMINDIFQDLIMEKIVVISWLSINYFSGQRNISLSEKKIKYLELVISENKVEMNPVKVSGVCK